MKENINNIQPRRIDARNPGPHVLLTAGVHGDEYEPMVAAVELIAELQGLLVGGSVTIVPVVNRSAYSLTSRYGKDGLDLARICPGDAKGSASLRNAFQISALIRGADYLVDMHTGGFAHDIFPMAGYMLHPLPDILNRQRDMAMAYNFPVVWGTDHLPDGRTLSVARDAGIPAIYLEYGGGAGFRRQVVKAYREGFLNLLKVLKMIDGAPDIISRDKRFWVEDSRPDSGYFQGKMPAPAGGIFVAQKMPGETIKKDELFGNIISPDGGQGTAVCADADGLVLSVRVLVKVETGEALGSILPIREPGKIVVGNKQ